jgi:hypothetical protein
MFMKFMKVMTGMRGFTSVPVKPETLQRLKQYKVAGKTYDDVLNDFMDETPTEEFLAWHLNQVKTQPHLRWDPKKEDFVE